MLASVEFVGERPGIRGRQQEGMAIMLRRAKVFLVQQVMVVYQAHQGALLVNRISFHPNPIRVNSRQMSLQSHIHLADLHLLQFNKHHMLLLLRQFPRVLKDTQAPNLNRPCI